MRQGPSFRLFAALYPFGAGAMGVNVFFLSLIWSWVGWPVLTPWESAFWGLIVGVPATWAFARHIDRLMREVDGK